MGFDGLHEMILLLLLTLFGAAIVGGIVGGIFKLVFRIRDEYAPFFLASVPAFWTARYIWNYPFSWLPGGRSPYQEHIRWSQ